MFKNIASQKLTVFAFDATTNLPKTGDAANLTAYVDKDDGGVTVLADTSATEKDSTNAKGYYIFDLAQGETNGDKLLFTAKSATSNIVVIAVPPVVFTVPPNFTATSINSSGQLDIIKVNGTSQTARDIGASVLLSAGSGTGQLDFTSGVVKANATQWIGGTIPAVNITGVPLVDNKYVLGTAVTEGGSGRLAGAFTKFFDKASPTGTINSLPDAVPNAAGGLLNWGTGAYQVNQTQNGTLDSMPVWELAPRKAAAGVTTAFSTQTTSHAVTLPTPLAGDLLLAFFSNVGTSTVTTPTGWTQLQTNTNGGSDLRIGLYARAADGTEASTVDFVTSAAQRAAAQVFRIPRGNWYGDSSSSFAASIASGNANGSSVSPNPPSISAGWGKLNNLWIAVEANLDGTATDSVQPTSYGDRVNIVSNAASSGISLTTLTRTQGASSEDPSAFTIASNPWVAMTVALRPAQLAEFTEAFDSSLDTVLVSSGTGTGQIDLSSGQVKVQYGTSAGQINLSAGLITSSTYAAGAITAAAIADGAIDAATFAASAINAAAIASGAITSAKFAASAIDATAIADGAIDRATFAADTGLQAIRSNTATAGGSTSITLDASASSTTDYYKNALIVITGGTGIGQGRFCTAYNGSTKVATVGAWAVNPDNTSTFAILAFDSIPGATAPTAAQVATQVFTDLLSGSDFSTAGSFGKLVKDNLDAAITSRMASYTQPTGFLAATFPTTVASTTNITAATGITVSALGTGVITATSIAADAITAAKIADGAIDTATFAAGTTIPRCTLTDTLATYTGNTPQTGDTYARLGAPAGASIAADLAEIEAETDGIASIPTSNPTAAAIATAIWQDATAGDFTVSSSIGKALYVSNVAPGGSGGLAIVGSAMTLTSPYDFAKGTVAVTESYNADGAAPTPVQALMVILQMLTELGFSGTTGTVKKLDGTTTALTLTINDATTPTSITRST